MQGLTKLLGVTVLKNAANLAAEFVNMEAVVELILKRKVLTYKMIDLKKEQAQMKVEVKTLKTEAGFFKW